MTFYSPSTTYYSSTYHKFEDEYNEEQADDSGFFEEEIEIQAEEKQERKEENEEDLQKLENGREIGRRLREYCDLFDYEFENCGFQKKKKMPSNSWICQIFKWFATIAM